LDYFKCLAVDNFLSCRQCLNLYKTLLWYGGCVAGPKAAATATSTGEGSNTRSNLNLIQFVSSYFVNFQFHMVKCKIN